MARKIVPAMAVFQRARRLRTRSASPRAASESGRGVIRSAEPTRFPTAPVSLWSGWLIDTPLVGPGAHELLIPVTFAGSLPPGTVTPSNGAHASQKRCVIVDFAYADRPPVRYSHPPHARHARRDG